MKPSAPKAQEESPLRPPEAETRRPIAPPDRREFNKNRLRYLRSGLKPPQGERGK